MLSYVEILITLNISVMSVFTLFLELSFLPSLIGEGSPLGQ